MQLTLTFGLPHRTIFANSCSYNHARENRDGHRAKYSIPDAELKSFVDGLWQAGGQYSAIARADLNEGEPANREEMEQWFSDLGWPPLKDAIQFHSPVEADGGGAQYYYEPSSGTAYHRAGYW